MSKASTPATSTCFILSERGLLKNLIILFAEFISLLQLYKSRLKMKDLSL
jgi:hypothetical protein